MGVAWFLAALAGVPVLVVTAWGLAGGYSFRYLPFMLVPVALPFAVAPLIAGFLSLWRPGSSSRAASVTIGLLCSCGSAMGVLAIGFMLPFSLLASEQGHAGDNFDSLAWAGLLTLVYCVAATVATVGFGARAKAVRADSPPGNRSETIRIAALLAGGVAVLLLLSGVAGLAGANSPDASGVATVPSAQWMDSRPESALRYPGSITGDAWTVGEERQLSHSRQAKRVGTLLTADAPASVGAWYTRELLARGWRTAPHIGYGEDQQWTFKRGTREEFLLQYYRPGARFPEQVQHPGDGLFFATYEVYPIDQPAP